MIEEFKDLKIGGKKDQIQNGRPSAGRGKLQDNEAEPVMQKQETSKKL